MGVRNLFRRVLGSRRVGSPVVRDVFSTRSQDRGISVDRALAYTVTWACVSLKAETWASLPTQHLREQTREGRRLLTEVSSPSPLLIDPSGDGFGTWAGLISQVSTSLDLYGNAFLEVSAPANGRVTLGVLDPTCVTVNEVGEVIEGDGWSWRVSMRAGGDVMVPRWRRGREWGIMHIPHLRPPGRILGLAPLQAAAEAVAVGQEAEAYAGRFFANSARPDVMIEFPINVDVDDEMVRRVGEGWTSRHSGAERAHRVGVLTDGARLHTLSIPPEQAQFLETRVHQAEDIARAFGVPQHAVGLLSKSTSWGTGIEEQSLGFARFTLGGLVARFDAAISALLPRGQVFRTRLSEIERGSFTRRVDAFGKLRAAGVVSANDVREALGFPVLDDPVADLITAPAITPGEVIQEAFEEEETDV